MAKRKVAEKTTNKKCCFGFAHKLGLTLGIFFAFLHAVWALLVGINVGQGVINWIMPLHFLDAIYNVLAFNFLTAVMLVVMAFIGGYVMGWIIGWLWCKLEKC